MSKLMRFGKYKGIRFEDTPKSYQDWLQKQDWFYMPKEETELTPTQKIAKKMSETSRSLRNWNGYSRGGQAKYDSYFELEQQMEDLQYCRCGKQKDENDNYCEGDTCDSSIIHF